MVKFNITSSAIMPFNSKINVLAKLIASGKTELIYVNFEMFFS